MYHRVSYNQGYVPIMVMELEMGPSILKWLVKGLLSQCFSKLSDNVMQ